MNQKKQETILNNTPTSKSINIKDHIEKLDFIKNKDIIDAISFVKIDVEGAEKLVLDSMKDILKNSDRIKIFSEIDLARLNDAGSNYNEVIEFLYENNFTIFLVDEKRHAIVKMDKESLASVLEDEPDSQNILCLRENS